MITDESPCDDGPVAICQDTARFMLSDAGIICFASSYAIAWTLEISRLPFRGGLRVAGILLAVDNTGGNAVRYVNCFGGPQVRGGSEESPAFISKNREGRS
jgi:hypothetical protein